MKLKLSDARTPEQQARAIEHAVIAWRADLRRRHEKRLSDRQEAGAYLSPPRTEDDPKMAEAPRRPTRSEDDADWRRRASVPWPSGTR